MGWSHSRVWQSQIRKDISAAGVQMYERGIPAPQQAPQPRVPVLGREVPIIYGWENQGGLWLSETRAARVSGISLKGPHMNLIYWGLTHSELQCWGRSCKAAKDIRDELNCLPSGPGLEGQHLLRQKWWQVIVLLLSPPPDPACMCRWPPCLILHQPG